MKYSSCYYPSGPENAVLDPTAQAGKGETLAMAEEAMLEMYTEKAGLGDGTGEGLRLLDLGCGWGSLGLYLAEVSV